MPNSHIFLSGFILGTFFGMSGLATFSAGMLTGIFLLKYQKNL